MLFNHKLPVLAGLCLWLMFWALAQPLTALLAQGRIAEGQPFPEFLLPRIDNREPVALADYRGRKILLIQFASW